MKTRTAESRMDGEYDCCWAVVTESYRGWRGDLGGEVDGGDDSGGGRCV